MQYLNKNIQRSNSCCPLTQNKGTLDNFPHHKSKRKTNPKKTFSENVP